MILYDESKLDKLKFKFNSVETIKRNYSQSYQDMFVLSMLNGKKNGTFLEIGAMNATFISNTYLLENQFNWTGVSIDIDQSTKSSFEQNNRTSNLIIQNALEIDYESLLKLNNFENRIDYLQLDIEPQTQTLNCLKLLPLDKYRFSVITYETDFYDPSVTREVAEKTRRESREILKSHGYELVVGNICNLGNDPFEDWYIDPSVINPDIVKIFKNSEEYNDTSESYMLKQI